MTLPGMTNSVSKPVTGSLEPLAENSTLEEIVLEGPFRPSFDRPPGLPPTDGLVFEVTLGRVVLGAGGVWFKIRSTAGIRLVGSKKKVLHNHRYTLVSVKCGGPSTVSSRTKRYR